MSLENMPNFEERRECIRAKRIVTVRYRSVKHKGKSVNSRWQMSVTQDMSLTGLLFVSAMDFKKDDVIELEVVMSGMLEIFKGFGQVVRSAKQSGGHYSVAVKYIDFKPSSKTRSAKKHH
jgi:hypothetical protein